ncbi:sugar/nucleoside kinase (ribokinase family) [Aquimarina sp. MAR_2010_214]|uniref:PfkB family carbohydrate kinase n=1 Tax=Aquimarina sp. MAR_2010_214 TaxID=1250026 RepID=UPI000C715A30|nr:PfkB family carbohydrate kinase [Aquimarina sp. MAR_2010_214]PKV48642.1 sugar/nucleoside kinase (ribokinase family) [Aquimarina sp. MAR_2010_214]
MSKLLIVGSMAFDAIETPFGKTDKILGGAAPYIALSASNFNISSAIVSVVGEDFPLDYLSLLQEKNIDTSAVEIVKGGKTFFWRGRYHNDLNSRDTLDTQLNVLADFNPVVPDNYKDADIIMLGNLNPSVQLGVIEQLTSKPKLTILDTMNFWMEDAFLGDLLKVISKVDVITINDEEARQLSGEYSLVKAARAIEKMGPKYVVIKKGEHGALLFHEEQIFFAPALPLEEVFDPTGAGDTFAGGFSGYLTKTGDISFENMKKAIIHASNLASFCVEKFGTERMENLNKDEVQRRLQQFRELTQFEIELS